MNIQRLQLILWLSIFFLFFSCHDEDGLFNGSLNCQTSKDCQYGYHCSRLGKCLPSKTCSSHSDCLPNEHCYEQLGLCLQNPLCSSATDCKNSLVCVAGLCLGCQSNMDCNSPEVCIAGTCLISQNMCTHISCDDKQFCNPLTQACEPLQRTCQSHQDCYLGTSCVEQRCKLIESSCQTITDCSEGQNCEMGFCFGCQSDQECKKGSCIFGICVESHINLCQNKTCLDLESCDPQTGQCYAKNGQCTSHLECRPGTLCQSGLCIGCQDDSTCHPNFTCFYGMCIANDY